MIYQLIVLGRRMLRERLRRRGEQASTSLYDDDGESNSI